MSQTPEGERPAIAAAIVVEDGQVLMVRRQVREGDLSWQFPAGQVEAGESAAEATVRETREETGVTVRAMKELGHRVHPGTGRTMCYVACEFVSGTAEVADAEELAEVAWCGRAVLATNVPYPLFGPVQDHLNAGLR
jgi:8-oxo-dGTP diphosphatase